MVSQLRFFLGQAVSLTLEAGAQASKQSSCGTSWGSQSEVEVLKYPPET
jgi:hypothetical protein